MTDDRLQSIISDNTTYIRSFVSKGNLLYCCLIAGIPGGHIPGSIDLPFKTFLTNDEDSKFQTMRTTQELLKIFRKAEIDFYKPMTATCGVGKIYILYYQLRGTDTFSGAITLSKLFCLPSEKGSTLKHYENKPIQIY